MKKSLKVIFAVLATLFILSAMLVPAFAAEAAEPETVAAEAAKDDGGEGLLKTKAIVAGAIIAAVATAGAIAMCVAINGASKNIARQPEAAGNIRTNVMLGLVFIETAIIYALIVAILVIFVL